MGLVLFIYKRAWPLIGGDLIDAVLDFFRTGKLYLVTSRLQVVLGSLVYKNQESFVPGRVITNNIILRHELVKGYGRKCIYLRCISKVDMRKAYESIDWTFLEQILEKFEVSHVIH